MAEFPTLDLRTDAYLSDTRHLSQAQHGGYLLLLMTAWRTKECALPDDDKLLARYAGCSLRTWVKQKPIIMAFWTLGEGGFWTQKRLSEERNKASIRSAHSKNAADAKWLKAKKTKMPVHDLGICEPDAPRACDTDTDTEVQEDSMSNPSSESIQKPSPLAPPVGPYDAIATKEPDGLNVRFLDWKKLTKKGANKIYPEQFDWFWDTYSRRPTETKKTAYQYWARAANDPNVGMHQLQQAAEAQREFIERSGHPPKLIQTWINAEGWTADLKPTHETGKQTNGYEKSDSELAQQVFDDLEAKQRRLERYANADARAEEAHVEGQGDQPDSSPGRDHGHQGDGRDDRQIPNGLDRSGD